jgi:zinc metalloprotease ZmpB
VPQEYNDLAKAHVDRDDNGVVRGVLHVEQFYASAARTPLLAAQDYLEHFAGLLGLRDTELRSLALSVESTPTDDGVEYRLWAEKSQFDTTTVTFSQSYFGLPIWEAGLAVQMKVNPFRIMSAQSTAHTDVRGERPTDAALRRLSKLSEEKLAHSLGLSAQDKRFDRKSLHIERQRLFVYRYEADQRVRLVDEVVVAPAHPGESAPHHHHYPTPPLPPVPRSIEEGRHYVVAAVYFVLGVPGMSDLRWVALVEAESLSVLLLRAFVASVDGLVFVQDPVTANGGPLPNAGNAALNPLRSAVLLKKLDPPAGGNYALVGDVVQIKDVELPAVAPPTEAIGTDFNFNARSDNFSAVNAYYHADSFFRLVQEFGFDLNVYFGGTLFPTVVDHRGFGPPFGPPGGLIINAHCLGTGAFGILQTSFALADLSNVAQPLGIACDQRIVLHELSGHGTLYNHVNSANFGFAHSAGDSIGVVLNDPDSQAPDRFMTFPWLYQFIPRRQDRTPAFDPTVGSGWGWAGLIALNPFGPLDIGGYNNEKILSSTHFRIYRSIGGDSTERAMRVFAGHYVAYLILRTIGGLTQPTNPPNALTYATFLMGAELGDLDRQGAGRRLLLESHPLGF